MVPTGAWVFMTKRGGKQRPIGLGSARDVPLKDARELAEAPPGRPGRDPKTVLAEAAGELTFDAAGRELIESMARAGATPSNARNGDDPAG